MHRMKIGIITFHRAANYGAVLQAYALQHTLEGLGVQTEMVDYKNKEIEEFYNPLSLKGNKVKALVKIALFGAIRHKRNQVFGAFVEKYLHVSKKVYHNCEELAQAEKLYDAFVTGSDQVWNTDCAGFDPAYFLTFVSQEKKKNSYAASFGFPKIPDGYEAEYRSRLSHYNNISVRENSGREIVKRLTGREVPVVLDPTLLLSGSDWESIAQEIPRKGYILVYNVLRSDGTLAYARKLSKEKGLPVVYLNDKWFENRDFEHAVSASPEEFLGYFKQADYIVTSSFHGTVFSIIFRRPFVSDVNIVMEDKLKKNERAGQLLSALGLTERILSGETQIDDRIDWGAVEKTLDGLRWESFEYLNTIVDEENGK